jgi:hypothetical protein
LLAADVTDDELRWRLRIGSLHRLHRGVYRVGHQAPSVEAWCLAAVLAYEFRRYTHDDVFQDPVLVLQELIQLFAERSRS